MQIVLTKFSRSEDPLMEGHLLLEQYQAQYVAALRYAEQIHIECICDVVTCACVCRTQEAIQAKGYAVHNAFSSVSSVRPCQMSCTD